VNGAGSTSVPRIAVVGRQNVGKSTLVNRLFGKREAIAHDLPGVTRDRIELRVTWGGRTFDLVDTAGYLPGPGGVEVLTRDQADRALREADLILLVVDVHAGITMDDADLARRLRGGAIPTLVVANKVDSARDEADAAAFMSLGLGEAIAVSGLHGRATGDLLERIVHLLPEAPEGSNDQPGDEPRFAIVGRPNVGKSSLFNRLIGDERSVVFAEAGTTRDPVDAVVPWPDGPVRFVDTAGMRRRVKVQGVEYFSFVRASQAIERAHVGVVVIDAVEGLTVEDMKIANRVLEAGRALIMIANKWDLVQDKDDTYRNLSQTLTPLGRAQAMRVSAVTGRGVDRLPPVLLDLHRRWMSRVSTSRINAVMQMAQRERPTPRTTGTLHYVTQVSAGPPTFVVFGGAHAPDAGYRRFLENRIRREFHLEGVPVRLRFKPRTRNSSSSAG
jgi:GTP-binding protein